MGKAQDTSSAEQHFLRVSQKVPMERVNCLLVSAFEGGSNYWYMICEKIEATAWTFAEAREDDRHYVQEYALNPGGALMIDDSASGEATLKAPVRLDLDSIAKGLQVMAEKYPRHFSDMMSEDDDGETGDVLLQCCVLGDVIYG